MNDPISESLRTVHGLGADAFAATTLASNLGPTVRRVARRRVGRVVGAGVAALAVIGAVTVGALGYTGRTLAPGHASGSPTPSATSDSAMVVVKPGDTGEQIGEALLGAGVITSVADFVKEANGNPSDALRIQPGVYTLPRGVSPAQALAALLDRANRAGPTVVIPEGFTQKQVFERLHNQLGIPMADLEAVAKNPGLAGLPDQANGNLEGWLGTYTYYFDPGTTAIEALQAMVAATVANLKYEEVAPADWERVLTEASLVEREVSLDVDRPKVAAVIENRLAAGMPLGLDSTVRYAGGDDGSAVTTDQDRNSDSPYNTYRVKGLPPGPIASPGVASIDAVVHPAYGTWLYFVTVNPLTGEIKYATTYEEDVANVAELQAWLAANG